MTDILRLILDDHEWFRARFAALDELRARGADADTLRAAWQPLADRLDVHAVAEEEIFYPQLLKRGDDDPEAETLDAIGDHNDIRDGVHDAARHPVGGSEWWDAVARTRVANDEHMAEEEREGIADFRANPAALRESLGRRFAEFLSAHPTTRGLDTSDKDPDEYVQETEEEIDHADRGPDTSLGIGGLKDDR